MAAATQQYSAPLHPDLQELIDNGGAPPKMAGPDIPTMRAVMLQRKKTVLASQGDGGPPPDIQQEDITVPARDGYSIPVRTYKPKQPPAGGSPLIVIFHGGGFCIGGVENEELFCRLFVQKLGAVAFNVAYRLAPEHKFPVAIEDAWDSSKWAASHASEIGADHSQGFIVGGISAGANLASAVAHLAQDEKLSPPLTGLFLSIPVLCRKADLPEKYQALHTSMQDNKVAPGLDGESVHMFDTNYNPDTANHLHSSFNWPSHAGLPPVVFQACELDPVRDDAVVMEKLLREEYGIKTKMYYYKGLPHGFWSMMPQLNVSKQAVHDVLEGHRWLLEQHKA